MFSSGGLESEDIDSGHHRCRRGILGVGEEQGICILEWELQASKLGFLN